MSFILDALKKSEAERQRQAGPAMFQAPAARPRRGVPTWLIVTGALLVVVNLAGLLWVMLRPSSTSGSVPAAAAPPAAAPVTSARPAATPAAPAASAATAPVEAQPATTELAVPEPEAALPETPEDARIAGLKRYATLGSSVPPLRLDLHVYSTRPADRYALINMRKLREGDTTEDGVKVKEITRSGVVVLFRGEELLLARD